MTQDDTDPAALPAKNGEAKPCKEGEPQWARALRDMYERVVEEPLPDSFQDLIAKLDSASE